MSPKSFKATTGKPSKGKGATLSITASATKTLLIVVTARAPGFKSNSKCVAKKPKGTAKKCTFAKTLGTENLAISPAGKAPFDGAIADKKLKPGKYKLVLTPVGADGKAGAATTLSFTIKKG